ncbi:hypothetical protein GLOIN_2v1598257 [Rhizophagus clarus]|uniref:Uncharacterized protein n=2 Tax=Rhizophagus clarus TaxID=94130 RepID=A0A8H3QQH4_9GLOM|nr:hypothetical protein GLOIN_2v1598257 [Rhizophagus clarus]
MLRKNKVNGEDITNIKQFTPVFEKISDDDKTFKHCMEDIILKLSNVETMTDANEATRCEFISAILHASIAIAKKLTSQDIFIVLQKDISGEDATGRVDYAIKSLEEFLCITEGKPRNIKIGYAQNLAQLENGIYCTSGSEYQINLTKSAIKENPELLRSNVKRVIGIIVGLLKDRVSVGSSPTSKRIMSSELKLLKQRITELEAENVEIAKLRKENAELKKENTEIRDLRIKLSISDAEIAQLKRMNAKTLRANGKYNEMRDAENVKLKVTIKELKSENIELRDHITKVEQNQSLQNALTAIDNSSNNTSSNFNSVADQLPMITHHEKPLVDDTSLLEEPIPEVLPEISVSNNNADRSQRDHIKPSEDKKMDSFLNEVYKKKISNEIRQRNREKKLLCESSTKDLSISKGPASSVDKESRSHKKKEAENIVQDVFDFTMDGSEKNHMTEILLTGREENNYQKKIESQGCLAELSCSVVLQNINRLYENACTAENERVKANQAEILCWRNFIIGLDNSIDEIMIKEKVRTKKAKGLIYDFILAHNPDTKRKTLYQRISRARKVYEFTEKIGIDKIKYIKTYSANSIAELSDSQIQTIVDYFSNNPNTELPDDQEGSIIDSEGEISGDQTDASEAVSATRAEVSILTSPIPLTHLYLNGNSSDDSSRIGPVAVSISPVPQINESNQSRLPISILPEDPEEKQKYIIGLVLEKFPYLSLNDSDECRDTFNLNSSALCPLCNGDHKVNRSIFDEIKVNGVMVSITENELIVSIAGCLINLESQ